MDIEIRLSELYRKYGQAQRDFVAASCIGDLDGAHGAFADAQSIADEIKELERQHKK